MTYTYLSLKSTILLFLFSFVLSNVIAQSPALINYQAVVRDANGNLITTGTISLGISIHDAIVGGNQLYFETHNGITPNSFGIVNVLIGGGTVLSGNFLMINWGNGDKFLQVYVNNNPIGSRTQMVSVPYALYAGQAGKADSANYATQVKNIVTTGATNGQGLTYNGTNFVPTNIPNEVAWYNESLAHGAISSSILINNSWVTLGLNSTQYHTPTGSSISRNGSIITLQPGTYLIRAYVPIEHQANVNNWSRGVLRLRNTINGSTALKSAGNGALAVSMLNHQMEGVVTVSNSNSQDFQLEFLLEKSYPYTIGALVNAVGSDTGDYSTTNIIIQKLH